MQYASLTLLHLPKWYQSLQFANIVLASLNAAVNPIIYGVVNETFRKATCLMFPWLNRFLLPNENKRPGENPQVVEEDERSNTPRKNVFLRTSFAVSSDLDSHRPESGSFSSMRGHNSVRMDPFA